MALSVSNHMARLKKAVGSDKVGKDLYDLLGSMDGLTAGVVTASKGVKVDANKDIGNFRHVTLFSVKVLDTASTHTIQLLASTDEAANRTLSIPTLGGNKFLVVAASDTEALVLNAVVPGTVAASKGVVVDANKDVSAFRTVGLVNLDAGSSGVQGSIDVFPLTAAKGKLSLAAADNAGDTTTTITNAAMAGERTLVIPDPGGNANFAMRAQELGAADGAITIKDGVVPITKAGVAALTLAAPVAGTDDRKRLTIVATTAHAHTVTQASDGFNGGGAGADVATFGGAIGDSIEVMAYNGIWYVLNTVNVTLG